MGLASALSTALTGLTAAETQIDTIGNNLANAQTVGFKSSETVFATQFLQTLGLGSEPTESNGGTNPRQTGLGVQVSEITPDFSQGTIEISSSPSDLAIQGEGFFIVEDSTGEQLYTRNGVFKTNAQNELVTSTGQRLLGFGVDELFQLQTTELVALEVPLGSAASAKATQNVVFEGALTPTGDVADTAEVLESAILGDAIVPQPDVTDVTFAPASQPDEAGVIPTVLGGAGTLPAGSYKYRFTFVDNTGTESVPSDELTVAANLNDAIQLANLPDSGGEYSAMNVYRTAADGNDFFFLDSVVQGGTYVDDNSVTLSTVQLDDTVLTGNYSYRITYHKNGVEETRPSITLPAQNVTDGRLHLSDLPTPPVPTGSEFAEYDEIRVYRNLATDSNTFYLVETLSPTDSFTDKKTDAEISDLTIAGNKVLDEDGPKISPNTLLTNVLRRDENVYESLFEVGTLSFTGRKGGRSLDEKSFTITATSTVQELVDFMEDSLGIRQTLDDPQNPITGSISNIPGETGTLASGVSIQDGKLRIVANNGVDNAVSLGLSAFQLQTSTAIESPSLGFGVVQEARGQSAVSDFLVYDSLGIPVSVRMTAVLESRDGTTSTYRWYADSADNDPLNGNDIGVGTGQITFDGEGNFVSTTNNTMSIDRRNIPSASPLDVAIDFSQISGLQAESSSLNASFQDGSAPGTMTSFSISEDGSVRGVFTNGVSRQLGKIQLARFANPVGLEQQGLNMYASGANSGLPVIADAGTNGLGQVIAGAVELSNTDIGQNLVDLVLATTHYRGNTRVITAAQQLLDELLNLRR